MNSKERQEVLDLYKHISAGLMERKGDRLMLSKKINKVYENGHLVIMLFQFYIIVDSPRKANLVPPSSLKHILGGCVLECIITVSCGRS